MDPKYFNNSKIQLDTDHVKNEVENVDPNFKISNNRESFGEKKLMGQIKSLEDLKCLQSSKSGEQGWPEEAQGKGELGHYFSKMAIATWGEGDRFETENQILKLPIESLNLEEQQVHIKAQHDFCRFEKIVA